MILAGAGRDEPSRCHTERADRLRLLRTRRGCRRPVLVREVYTRIRGEVELFVWKVVCASGAGPNARVRVARQGSTNGLQARLTSQPLAINISDVSIMTSFILDR